MAAQIEVDLKNVEATRTAEGVNEDTDVTFSVNSSLNEEDRGHGFITLKFSISLDTEPSAARLFVAGTASVTGTEDEIDELLAAKERDGTPTAFMKVYQKIYPAVYLLCGSLHVPYPGPGLLRQNGVETGEPMVADPPAMPKRMSIPQ